MMWEVYWITDNLNEDIHSYGYVGITSLGIQKRFTQHKNLAFNKRSKGYWRELSKFIRQNIGCLSAVTICSCGEQYARELEVKLRPKEDIGLNLAAGGSIPTTKLTSSEKHSRRVFQQIVKQLSEYNKRPWSTGHSDWSDAQIVYEEWVKKPCGMRSLCTRLNQPRNKRYLKYITLFKTGWVPANDTEWRNYFDR